MFTRSSVIKPNRKDLTLLLQQGLTLQCGAHKEAFHVLNLGFISLITARHTQENGRI
jgi:hypothetical protein